MPLSPAGRRLRTTIRRLAVEEQIVTPPAIIAEIRDAPRRLGVGQ